MSLRFVPKGPINIIPSLVQIMASRLTGAKPLSEPMMVSLLMHISLDHNVIINQINGSIIVLLKLIHLRPSVVNEIFKHIFSNENAALLIKYISRSVPCHHIPPLDDNKPVVFQTTLMTSPDTFDLAGGRTVYIAAVRWVNQCRDSIYTVPRTLDIQPNIACSVLLLTWRRPGMEIISAFCDRNPGEFHSQK